MYFVAKTYGVKMAGAISAHNTEHGVTFTLTLERVVRRDLPR